MDSIEFLWNPINSYKNQRIPIKSSEFLKTFGFPTESMEFLCFYRIPWNSCGIMGSPTEPKKFLWFPWKSYKTPGKIFKKGTMEFLMESWEFL